eukprot:Rmarinus@m.19105
MTMIILLAFLLFQFAGGQTTTSPTFATSTESESTTCSGTDNGRLLFTAYPVIINDTAGYFRVSLSEIPTSMVNVNISGSTGLRLSETELLFTNETWDDNILVTVSGEEGYALSDLDELRLCLYASSVDSTFDNEGKELMVLYMENSSIANSFVTSRSILVDTSSFGQYDPVPLHNGEGLMHAAAFWNDTIVAFGGIAGGIGQDVLAYSIEEARWAVLVDGAIDQSPSPRYAHAQSLRGHSRSVLWLFGGASDTSLLGDVWEFDMAELTWTEVDVAGEMTPSPRAGHTATLVLWPDASAETIAVFGGRTNGTGFSSELWTFDLATRAWTLASDAELSSPWPSARYQHTVVAFAGSSLVLYGGFGSSGVMRDIWMFNSGTQSWEELPSVSVSGAAHPGRYGHNALIHASMMFVYGGTTTYGDVHSTMEAYDFGGQLWRQFTLNNSTMPGRDQLAASLHCDDLYISGGGTAVPHATSLRGDLWHLPLSGYVSPSTQSPNGERLGNFRADLTGSVTQLDTECVA